MFRLINGDFRQAEVAPASVHLIFTDPPYGRKYLELWSGLAIFAENVLVEGGYLVTYSGQYWLPTAMQALAEHLTYRWIIAMIHSGTNPTQWVVPGKVTAVNGWKPLLVYQKGKPTRTLGFIDAYGGTKGRKDLHEWAQGDAEANYYISKFSRVGEIVCDPMMGSGTTIRQAVALGREALGIELSPETFEIAKKSLPVQ